MGDDIRRPDIIEGFKHSRVANETLLLPFRWVAGRIHAGNASDQDEHDMGVLLDRLEELLQLLIGHSTEELVIIMRLILDQPNLFGRIPVGQDCILGFTKFSLQMAAGLETVLVDEGTVVEVTIRGDIRRLAVDELFNGSFAFALELVEKLTIDGRVALKLNDPDPHAPRDATYTREMGNADKFLRDCFTRYWKRSSLNVQLPGGHNNAEANRREMYHEVTKLVMNIQHALTESGPDNSLTLEE